MNLLFIGLIRSLILSHNSSYVLGVSLLPSEGTSVKYLFTLLSSIYLFILSILRYKGFTLLAFCNHFLHWSRFSILMPLKKIVRMIFYICFFQFVTQFKIILLISIPFNLLFVSWYGNKFFLFYKIVITTNRNDK